MNPSDFAKFEDEKHVSTLCQPLRNQRVPMHFFHLWPIRPAKVRLFEEALGALHAATVLLSGISYTFFV